jgi:hypothetical protein
LINKLLSLDVKKAKKLVEISRTELLGTNNTAISQAVKIQKMRTPETPVLG